MMILRRVYGWQVEHDRSCSRFMVPADSGGSGSSGRMQWVRSCHDDWTSPPNMYAADGCRIPFPEALRESDAYRNADSVVVEVFLDVDTTGYEREDLLSGPSAVVETTPDGEVDFGSIQGNYEYVVLVSVRRDPGLPIGAADFVPAPVPVSVAMSMATPTEIGGEVALSRRMSNGVMAHYYVHC